MTISSSMNAGVMGLTANASKLGVISDNIANSSTYGYKRSEADFHSMVTGNSTSAYTAGGVSFSSSRQIDRSGSLVGSSNPTDLAVRGRGMLPVTSMASVNGGGSLPLLLTTTGSFKTDANGYLTTDTGLVLMGWPANADGTIPQYSRDTIGGLEPIRINSNEFVADPTTAMKLGLNLPATSAEGGALGGAESLSVEYYDNMGKSSNLGFTFTPTAGNTWRMDVTDSANPGVTVASYELTFGDSRTDGGTLIGVSTLSTTTVPAANGDYDPATGAFSITTASGPIEMNIGRLGDSGGFTQLSDSFVPSATQKNGSTAGSLVGVTVDANGHVNAQYDNGVTRTLFQVPLADVPNMNGLKAMDDQTYQITRESGSFFLWNAGDGPTGEVAGYAREESTSDVATELTDLIQTQRAYSSNAKIIQTVDEMLQETTNIKR
jgi:flagellar hook protein FlgE